MKTNVIILMLFVTMAAQSQREFQIFGGFSIDPKMAVSGPYNGKTNDIGTTFNGEFKIGVEKENFRVGVYVELHPAIHYQKWTWVAIDYKIADFPFKNFATYAGLEMSVIFRQFPDASPLQVDNFRKHTATRISNPGANGEIQYRLFKDRIFLGAGLNIFRAEQVLIDDGKQMRWDAMVSVYLKI